MYIYISILTSRFSTHHNESFSSLKHTSSFYTIFNSIREQQTFQEKKDNTIRKSGNNSFPLVCSDKREKGSEREREKKNELLFRSCILSFSSHILSAYESHYLTITTLFLSISLSSFFLHSSCVQYTLTYKYTS